MSGCGGGGGSSDTVPVASGNAGSSAGAGDPMPAAPHPLNLSLHLAYLGAQYYGYGVNGAGLATTLTGGAGRAGAATGARQVAFADPVVGARLAEVAVDKQAHVAALRREIGAAVPAQPSLDLSAGAGGAFSTIARTAGLVGAGASFDPYADDRSFLFGAFLVENAAAAAYRSYLRAGGASAAAQANLADVIHHDGLVRALLDARTDGDAALAAALTGAGAMFARLDGTDTGDQTLAAATGTSANLVDAAGRPIPFTRADAQVLAVLCLSKAGAGGFLPAGANGLAA